MRIVQIDYMDAIESEGENEENLISRQFIGDLEIRHVWDYKGHKNAITVVGSHSQHGVLILPSVD